MPRNNIHILDNKKLDYLNNTYVIDIKGDLVIVSTKHHKLKTAHSKNEKFWINSKVCHMVITPEAIKIWDTKFKKTHSLFDVQNAMNKVIVTYQTPSIDEIEKNLK